MSWNTKYYSERVISRDVSKAGSDRTAISLEVAEGLFRGQYAFVSNFPLVVYYLYL